MGVSVYGCVRARVWCMITCLLYPELNQSVSNQNPAKGSTSWPRHLQKILHWPCTKFAKILGSWARSWAPGQDLGLLGKILSSQQDRGLMGKILASWARSWPHGQDLEHLAQVSWPRTFCWVKVGHFCLLEVSHFGYLEVSHCVSASQR